MVPYSFLSMAMMSFPVNTSVFPVQLKDPSMVAPYLNRRSHDFSSSHDDPPLVERNGTAQFRNRNIVLGSLMSSLEKEPDKPVALLQGNQMTLLLLL